MKIGLIAAALAAGALLIAGSGCAASANPLTHIAIDPVSRKFVVDNNKDVSLAIKGFKMKSGAVEVQADDFNLQDNASAVRLASVEQQKAQNDLLINLTGQYIGAMQSLIPAVAPIVGQHVAARDQLAAQPSQLQLLAELLAPAIAQKLGVALPAPATQPAAASP